MPGIKILLNKPTIVILIISLAMFSFILMAGQADAYERPDYKDGLTGNWHPGSFCIPCHYTLLGNERAKEISSGCTKACHAIGNRPKDTKTAYKIEIASISKIHKDIVCIKCHVGTKSEKNVTAVDFHRVMSKTACLDCHTYVNGSYLKPQRTACSDCHGENPHIVHGKRLDKMCEACHGEFAEKFISKLELPSNLSNMSRSAAVSKSETIKEYPTIGQIISRIFALIR
ncbi:MAG: hypothetical protein FIB08_06000 [Candidatus Methanoperedens sp.]|nr:hypothetical protein [Candidatus Methanoperedens sp.]